MIFKIFLNCFFPSFNSKIETWVICEAQAQVLQWITSKSIQSFWALKKSKPNRIQQAQPNTQTHQPKTKTLITHKHTTHNPQTLNTQTLLWLYNKTQKKKKKSESQPNWPIRFSQFHIKKKKKKMLSFIYKFHFILYSVIQWDKERETESLREKHWGRARLPKEAMSTAHWSRGRGAKRWANDRSTVYNVDLRFISFLISVR